MRRSLQLPPLILNEVREAQDPYEEESPDARAIKRQRTISQARLFRISTKKLATHDNAGSGDSKKPRQAGGSSMFGLTKVSTKALHRRNVDVNQSRDYFSTKLPSSCKNFALSDAAGGYSTESGTTSRTISTACTNSSSDDSSSTTAAAVTYLSEYQQKKPDSSRGCSRRENSSRKSARDKNTLVL